MRIGGAITFSLLIGWGCQSPAEYRDEADAVAGKIIDSKQMEALGRTEPFTIERESDTLRRKLLKLQGLAVSGPASYGPDDLPKWEHAVDVAGKSKAAAQPAPWEVKDGQPLKMNLRDALQIGARNSREYQTSKESVFRSALALDLERDDFRNTFSGFLDSVLRADLGPTDAVAGNENSFEARASRNFKNGMTVSSRIVVDVVKLLTQDRSSNYGVFADATISMPLLRGSGRHIVTEPLTQAERNVVYSIHTFERFKHGFSVDVASAYLRVLQDLDGLQNAEANYKSLVYSTRRNKALAAANQRTQIEVDQARQNELSSRVQWIRARDEFQAGLDQFKLRLGLPPDARIELDRDEMTRLRDVSKDLLSKLKPLPEDSGEVPSATAPIELALPTREGAGRLELTEEEVVSTGFENRLDLRTAHGRVFDSQRGLTVAADGLRAGLALVGSAASGEGRSLGSASGDPGKLRPERGSYSVGLQTDLPWERTAQRNILRQSLIELEASVRDAQELEDRVKLELRNQLRRLTRSRENIRIQAMAVTLAERRVESTREFIRLAREGVQVRDELEALDDLISAQNALTAALIEYRVGELELQRDMGVLRVDEKGLFTEYSPQGGK